MNGISKERLYNLLPAIYRQRDQAQGEPLRTLMAGLESEFLTLEADMDALYDNWFIETCEEWVVPYLSDNVGVYNLRDKKTLFASQRRQVANVIAYRRRKGVSAILERVTTDATGWDAHVVEYARLLASTQRLASVRPEQGKFVDLHQAVDLDALGGPFDPLAHTVDLRHAGISAVETSPKRSTLRGLHQPRTIGLFIWRLQSYLITGAPVGVVTREATSTLPAACFTFDPLKRDRQLFNQSQPLEIITTKSAAVNLPGPISRVSFAADLKEYAKQYGHLQNDERAPLNSAYYGPDRGLCVLLNGKLVPPARIISSDLSHWHVSVQSASKNARVAIDVSLGRLRLLGKHPLDKIESVEVNYSYAFSSNLGGGPYTRELPPLKAQTEPYYIYVLKGGKINTLKGALEAWNAHCAEYEQANASNSEKLPCIGVIHILDNGVYAENDLIITLPKDCQLVLEAANDFHPIIHSHGTLTIVGKHAGANLQLNGLLIDSKLVVQGSMKLGIAHCTLMPYGIATQQASMNTTVLQITIDHSIVGPLQLRNKRGTLSIQDSIVDHASGYAIDTLQTKHESGPIVSLERVTVFGKVQVQAVRIVQDVLFTESIIVNNQQDGLIRFSYVPQDSQTPRRESCQPDLTRLQQSSQLAQTTADGSGQEPGETKQVTHWQSVYPLFMSHRYGDPAYAQLSMQCASQIRRGASEGSEMGAFHELYQAQRQDNLLHILEEYLPLGLNAGVLYVS